MDGVYHITRKKVYNKKICYISYTLFNILINIYDTARQAVIKDTKEISALSTRAQNISRTSNHTCQLHTGAQMRYGNGLYLIPSCPVFLPAQLGQVRYTGAKSGLGLDRQQLLKAGHALFKALGQWCLIPELQLQIVRIQLISPSSKLGSNSEMRSKCTDCKTNILLSRQNG